jgi:hypothetical protein
MPDHRTRNAEKRTQKRPFFAEDYSEVGITRKANFSDAFAGAARRSAPKMPSIGPGPTLAFRNRHLGALNLNGIRRQVRYPKRPQNAEPQALASAVELEPPQLS